MLYKTHKKFGYVFGLIALVLSFLNGWMVTFAMARGFQDKILIFFLVYIAIRGAVFGASFPDIDSPGSVPARHYPFLRRVFNVLKIKHRGKVSHDFISVTVIFALVYIGMNQILNLALSKPLLTKVLGFYLAYIIARDIINQLAFYIVKNKKKRKKFTQLFKPLLAIGIYIIFTVLGYYHMGDSPVNLLHTNNFIAPMLRVWIIYGWVGSMSHLFADMLTNDGVWLLGFELAPAQIILLVKRMPIVGKKLLVNDMKTGTRYEDGWNLIVTVAIIPLTILAVYAVFGGDIGAVLTMIGGG